MITVGLLAAATHAGSLATPGKVEPAMAGFTKIVVKWQAVKEATSYKVYRNDAAVGTVSAPEYTDTGLTSGSVYFYKVTAVGADGESDASKPLEVHTLKPASGEESGLICKAVDSLSPKTVTAKNLLSSAQGALKVLQVLNTDLVSIDPGILQKMIDQEMGINDETPIKPGKSAIKAAGKSPLSPSFPPGMMPAMPSPPRNLPGPPSPNVKNGQGVASAAGSNDNDDKLSLDEYMAKHFKGHSFLDLYIHSKLTELAEMHWQAGKKKAALMLYEKSLSYLPDMQDMVFSTVFRMGTINFAHINLKSSKDDMMDALQLYQETMARYTKMFPNENDPNNLNIHKLIAARCHQCFPVLLSYEDYNPKILNYALAQLKAVKDINGNDPIIDQVIARYNGWKLGAMKVRLCNVNGEPIAGTVTVRNLTVKDEYDSTQDERTLEMGNGPVLLPIYHGHKYEVTAALPVPGGKPLLYPLHEVSHQYGQKVIYNRFRPPVVKRLPSLNAPGEIIVVMAYPRTPYNLKADIKDKTFTLSWDWVAPNADYKFKEFKVYCDGVEVATTTKPVLAKIKIESPKVIYKYTVCAFNTDGQTTDESLALNVPETLPEAIKPPPVAVDPAKMTLPSASGTNRTAASASGAVSKNVKHLSSNNHGKRRYEL